MDTSVEIQVHNATKLCVKSLYEKSKTAPLPSKRFDEITVPDLSEVYSLSETTTRLRSSSGLLTLFAKTPNFAV